MNKLFIRIVIVLTVMLFANCSDKKETGIVFEKEAPVKEGDTKAWLHKVENYKKNKKYFLYLFSYYWS